MKIKPTEFDFDRDLEYIKPGFFRVINPLYVFKKARTRGYFKNKTFYNKTFYGDNPVIVNLVIPKGATIFIGIGENFDVRKKVSLERCGKMRASKAYVYSIVHVSTIFPKRQLKHAFSGHDETFKYTIGKTVKPKFGFDMYAAECAGGIHFFLNVEQARTY